MKMTKMICTLGPSLSNEESLIGAIEEGMDVARFNFSHGDHSSQQDMVNKINNIKNNNKTSKDIALLLDTKGPEIRIGKFKNNSAVLKAGNLFTLVNDDVLGDENKVSISHKGLYKNVSIGKSILIDDGLIELKVVDIQDKDIICRVINGGIVENTKGVNVPYTNTNLPSLTEKDKLDIAFAIDNNFDFIAASFIRKAEDVKAVREILNYHNSNIKIISKIENKEGVDNFDSILDVSDGIMIARGDLGVEIPFEEIPGIQKSICNKCNAEKKIVVVATQMLDSMRKNPRPTRAEVSDVANAIYDGASAIMLSGESASGIYPIDSIKTMSRIVVETEKNIAQRDTNSKGERIDISENEAISEASSVFAKALNSLAIICLTETGTTALRMSFNKPGCPILAVTDNMQVARALMIVKGVRPVLLKDKTLGNIYKDLFEYGNDINSIVSLLIEENIRQCEPYIGKSVIITSGARKENYIDNILKIHIIQGRDKAL